MQNEFTTQLKFYQQPFLVLTISLCSGILIGYEYSEWYDFFKLLSISTIFLALIFYYRGWMVGRALFSFTIIGFLLIGSLLIQIRGGAGNENQLSEIYQKGDLLLLKLRDVGQSDKEWKKMTGDIQSIYKHEKTISVAEPTVLFVKTENFACETGDVILVSSDLTEITNPGNPGEFDAKNYWNKKGFNYMLFVGEDQYRVLEHKETFWITKQLNSIRLYLKASLEENLKGKELAIALALILGDKSLLDTEITTSFTNTGAMHILAVSGLHIGIIMQILMAFFASFSKVLSRKNAVILVVVIMWIYAIITGLSPSVLRAVFMFSILALAQLTGKNHNSINSLFFTAFILMLVDPYTLYDIGFQLSFLAMLGIFLFYRPIDQMIFVQNKWLKKVWQGTAIGFAAQLMTTPLSLYYFHQFPNYFVLTNIGLMASSGLILGFGIFLFTISWWTTIARFTGIILSFIVFVSLAFIEWVESLPGAVAYGFEVSIVMVFVLGCLILYLFLLAKKRSHLVFAYSIGMLLLIVIVAKRFDNNTVNEICVFNARQVIITVRKNDQLFCFYRAKDQDVEKVKFAVGGYMKLHPAKIHYFSLNKKNWKINSKSTFISARKEKGSIEIDINKRHYSILLSDFANITRSNTTLIGMPWVETVVDHSLVDGAFVKGI